ncbi:MAG: histidine--tRNA ligase [Elusimicrobiota bacterium]
MGLSSSPPSGFRDFPPDECAAREYAVKAVSETYRKFGFSQIATSAVEDLAVLTGKGGGENEKLIFKILKRGEKLAQELRPPLILNPGQSFELSDLGLRFDLTLPLARFYSRHQSLLPRPFKVFNIGPVWRAERAQKGRYREFYQCDADIIGSESLLCEIEVISAILAAFSALNIRNVAVFLNDRRLLFAILDRAGIPENKRGQACVILDKKDKIPPAVIAQEICALCGESAWKSLSAFIAADAGGGQTVPALNKEYYKEAASVIELFNTLKASFPENIFQISPTLVRGLDYYTSSVFEFRHPALSGSLGGGGRYDRLTEKFGGPSVPACGGSIGFERLLLLLEESGGVKRAAGPEFCVLVFDESLRQDAIELAARLRANGRTVDLYTGTGKLGAQFKYADAKKATHAILIGPEEKAAQKVKIKTLANGEERLVDAPPHENSNEWPSLSSAS